MEQIIASIPIPPSVNEYLMPVAGKLKFNKFGKPYRVGHLTKTDVHKKFLAECFRLADLNAQSISKSRKQILDYLDECRRVRRKFALKIDIYLIFSHDRLFCKNGDTKQLDRDNRIKPATDAIAQILKIDDKHFFDGKIEKIYTADKEKEQAIAIITPFIPRDIQDLAAELNLDL